MGQLSRAERDRIDTRPMSQVLVEHAAIEVAMRMPFLITTSGNHVPTNR